MNNVCYCYFDGKQVKIDSERILPEWRFGKDVWSQEGDKTSTLERCDDPNRALGN